MFRVWLLSWNSGDSGDVEDADAFDTIIVDPPVDRAGVETFVQVSDDDRLGVDTRRTQAEIVAENAAIAVREVAVEPDLHQRSARDGIKPPNARGPARDGDDDLIGINARLAREAQPLDDNVIERETVGIRLIFHRRRCEGAVERRRRAQPVGAHRGRDRTWAKDIGRKL